MPYLIIGAAGGARIPTALTQGEDNPITTLSRDCE